MLGYIVRRLLWAPVVLVAVTFITFVLAYYGPGDPVQVLMGPRYNPEVAERVREELGLNRPLHIQYLEFVRRTIRGDLGESIKNRGWPVSELIGQRIWVSVRLGILSMALSLALGIPLGLLAAMNQGRWLDTAVVAFTLSFSSVSIFITVPLMLILFVRVLHILPAQGWDGQSIFDARLVIPVIALGLPGVAGVTRLMRASALEVIGQDYVRTARAKGLPERIVVGRHILRNALLPIVTVIGLSLAAFVDGFYFLETLLGIPGIGLLAVESVFARDYPVIMAITLIVALSFTVANLVVDLAYGVIDPRIRYR